jgi:hypothetical protein
MMNISERVRGILSLWYGVPVPDDDEPFNTTIENLLPLLEYTWRTGYADGLSDLENIMSAERKLNNDNRMRLLPPKETHD